MSDKARGKMIAVEGNRGRQVPVGAVVSATSLLSSSNSNGVEATTSRNYHQTPSNSRPATSTINEATTSAHFRIPLSRSVTAVAKPAVAATTIPNRLVPAKRSVPPVTIVRAESNTDGMQESDTTPDENQNPFAIKNERHSTPNKRSRPSVDSGFGETTKIIPQDGERDEMGENQEIADSEEEGERIGSSSMEIDQDRESRTTATIDSISTIHQNTSAEEGRFERENMTGGEVARVMFNNNAEDISEWTIDKLRTECQNFSDRLVGISEELMEIMEKGGGSSSEGNDAGLLRHTRSYVKERVGELKAEIARRERVDFFSNQLPSRTTNSHGVAAAQSNRSVFVGAAMGSKSGSSNLSAGARSNLTTMMDVRMIEEERDRAASSNLDASSQRSASIQPAQRFKQVTANSLVSGSVVSAPAPVRTAQSSAPAAPNPASANFRFVPPSLLTDDDAPMAKQISLARSLPPPQPRHQPLPVASTSRSAVIDAGKGKGPVQVDQVAVQALLDGVNFEDYEEDEGEDEIVIHARQVPRRPALLPPPIRPAVNNKAPPQSVPVGTGQVALQRGQPALGRTETVGSNGEDPARLSKAPTMKHPWSKDVAKALRQRFGLPGFRQNQEEAINATLSGRDVFVLLPTGGGKSLCFQLPAVISSGKTKGVSIVVSPLLSLISDQCKSLVEKDIPVVYINGSMSNGDRDFAMAALRADPPNACLAYVTPELIVMSTAFQNILHGLHRRKQLARFVIDEAHCVSSWGHDFRPDYKQMGKLKQDYPGIPIIALTATANDRVKSDVLSNLGMRDSLVLTQSFNRPNLKYEVRPKTKKVVEDIATFITKQHHNQCGIIYCSSKAKCEETADKLRRDYKIEARHYHAGMNAGDRARIQTGWQNGDFHVICATIAFGMGIDKPDVRYVIHYSLSQSLEAYYQETGRAGRDGKTSVCVLYYAYGDTKIIHHLIDQSEGTREQKQNNKNNLSRVVQYCLNLTDCRRAQVLQYFGERFPAEKCHKTCDNCLLGNAFEQRDVTGLAKEAVQLVESIQDDKGITTAICVGILKGSKTRQLVDAGYDQSEYHGAASKYELGDVERLFQLLLAEDILGERFVINAAGFTNSYMTVGGRAQTLLSGKLQQTMAISGATAKKVGGEKMASALGSAAVRAVPVVRKAPAPLAGPSKSGAKGLAKQAVAYPSEEFIDLTDDAEGEGEDDGEEQYDEPVIVRKIAATKGRNERRDEGEDNHMQALTELTEIRRRSAKEQGCSPGAIMNDAALEMLALTLPANLKEYREVDGIDEDSYDWFLESGARDVCKRFAALNGKEPAIVPARVSKPSAAPASGPSKAKPKPKAAAKAPVKRVTKAKAPSKQVSLERFGYHDPAAKPRGGGGGLIKAMPVKKR